MGGVRRNCVCVKSSVMVGNGADAESVAMGKNPELARASLLAVEPDRSMAAAAEVVFAIAVAAGGRGWLWFPSYVVISIVLSSAHRCT